jgi:hypothetical protein
LPPGPVEGINPDLAPGMVAMSAFPLCALAESGPSIALQFLILND